MWVSCPPARCAIPARRRPTRSPRCARWCFPARRSSFRRSRRCRSDAGSRSRAIEPPFAVTATGGYVPARHLAPIDSSENDFVAVAERFLGAPYLWGGKTSLGLDCSALVQLALTACGIALPARQRHAGARARDVDRARPTFPTLRRGDLLFWKGHVAIVRDPATLIHANAFHMAVASEPIAQAIARIRADGSEPTSVRRLERPTQLG